MHKKLEIISFAFVILGSISPIIIQYLYYNTVLFSDINEQGKLGPVSDWISGTITPFVALASFILLYITYLSQTEELKLTRKTMNEQSDTLKKQRFENTFFNLLSVFQSNINSIDILIETESVFEERYKNYKGRSFFEEIYRRFRNIYEQQSNELEEIMKLSRSYEEISSTFGQYFNHLFNNVYQMLKLIYMSELDINEKVFYVDIIRQHLSRYEFLLLFYDSLIGNGCMYFEMVYQVGLLRKGNFEELLSERHESMYFNNYKGDISKLYSID